MSHESTLFLLSVLVVLSPFLGLPYSWLMVILPALGIALGTLSIILRARSMQQAPQPIAVLEEVPLDENQNAVA